MPFTLLPVTLILVGGCALINLWLSLRIGLVRTRERIMVGDGGDDRLVRRMRAQANFIENAPFVVLAIAAIEFSSGTSPWLWAAAAAFLVARVAHPFGMDGVGAARMAGAAVTMLLLLVLGIWAIAIPLVDHRHAATVIPVETVPNG